MKTFYQTKRKRDKSQDLEKVSKISETVQGDAYSVRELFNKHTLGLDEKLYKPGYYSDNADLDDDLLQPEGSGDLTDIDVVKEEYQKLQEKIDQAKSARLKNEEKKRSDLAAKQLEAKINAEVAKRMKSNKIADNEN